MSLPAKKKLCLEKLQCKVVFRNEYQPTTQQNSYTNKIQSQGHLRT